jgi:hypothetical protein
MEVNCQLVRKKPDSAWARSKGGQEDGCEMTSKQDRETETEVEDALADRTKPAVPVRAKRGGLDMPEA